MGIFFHISVYLNIFFFFQMPEPTMIKKCRRVNVSFSNSQGSGRRLVKLCVITRQNGSEILTAQFVDTGTDLTTANLLDMIRMWWFHLWIFGQKLIKNAKNRKLWISALPDVAFTIDITTSFAIQKYMLCPKCQSNF